MGFDAPIFIVSEEVYLPYNRVLLPRLLKQEIQTEKVFFADKDWYRENNVRIALNTEISITDSQVSISQANTSLVLFSDTNYVGEFDQDLHIQLTQELSDNDPIIVIATGGDAYQPEVFPSSERIKTWRTLNDTLELQKDLSESNSVALVGGSFIGMELAMACDHYGVNTDWGIITKGFIRDALDPQVTTKLMEGFNSQVVNTCFEASFSDIHEENGKISAILQGVDKLYDCMILGTGIRPSVAIPKRFLKDNGMYYAGDMVSFEYQGRTVNTGSFNQSMKIAKMIAQDIVGEQSIEDTTLQLQEDIALTPYQIRFGGKPIRLAGLVDDSFRTEIELKPKITQTWYSDSGDTVGYCIV
jgi:hypothetical protein